MASRAFTKQLREDGGFRPRLPFRDVYGYDVDFPDNVLAQNVKAKWVDSDLIKYQVVEDLGDGMYKVVFRKPSPESERVECYFCSGSRHRKTNEKCISKLFDPPFGNEWVNIKNPYLRIDHVQVRDKAIKEYNQAGTAVIQINPDFPLPPKFVTP